VISNIDKQFPLKIPARFDRNYRLLLLMFRPFIFLLFCCVLLLSACKKSIAQESKIHWGLSVPIGLKFQLLHAGSSKYNLWGNTALCLTTIIEGEEGNALSILNKVGFSLDFTRYATADLGALIIDRGNFFFNPEILFPMRSDRLKISAGIGVEWNGYFLVQTEDSGVEYQSNLMTEMDEKRRKVLPFLSAGLFYNLKNNFYLQLFVRQMMLGNFTEEAEIHFNSQAIEPTLILNDKPTVAGIGISYFFD
jgi:hypothetical protein